MKKLILILSVLIYSHANAVVVVPHTTPPEKPPMEQCAYQEKVSDGLWKCYTQSQWDEKQRQEQIWKNSPEKKKSDHNKMVITFSAIAFLMLIIFSFEIGSQNFFIIGGISIIAIGYFFIQ